MEVDANAATASGLNRDANGVEVPAQVVPTADASAVP